jgi:NADH dehydrogenase
MMRVALIGGTGFVGSYLVDALLEAGHTPRLMVRSGSGERVQQPERCEIVPGHASELADIKRCLTGSDAVIYNIGILREFPSKGITFEELQYRGVERTVAAAQELGVRRFLLMSANGVKPNGTRYQSTKFRAEELLKGSGLDWTIFRPSVIFGPPRGRMEFCSQLRRDIIDSPLPAPLFYQGLLPSGAGAFKLAPVSVYNVAHAFVGALAAPATIGGTYALCGPDALSWKEILQTIARSAGRTKLMLPAPAFLVRMAATLLDTQPWFPITREQIDMLLEGNSCSSEVLFPLLGISPEHFNETSLAYLRA